MKGFKEITPIRKWRLLYAAIILAINIFSVFILYSHYGPLTENGNRYYHYFDLSSMDWYVLGHCLCAFVFLLIPWIFSIIILQNHSLDYSLPRVDLANGARYY